MLGSIGLLDIKLPRKEITYTNGSRTDSSASAMYANFGINNFDATIRKSTYGFTQRLAKSRNSLIVTIEKLWIVRIDIWNFWQKTLHIAPAT